MKTREVLADCICAMSKHGLVAHPYCRIHGWRNLAADAAALAGEARELIATHDRLWPDLEDVPEGEDVFAGEPVSGLPDDETLSRLVADANLTEID